MLLETAGVARLPPLPPCEDDGPDHGHDRERSTSRGSRVATPAESLRSGPRAPREIGLAHGLGDLDEQLVQSIGHQALLPGNQQLAQLRCRVAQPTQCRVGLALHRADGDAKDVGRLLCSPVVEVAQHEHRALLARERVECPLEHHPVLGVVERVGRGPVARLTVEPLASVATVPGHHVPEEDPSYVGLGLSVTHPLPSQRQLRQRVLQQVLGEMVVAAHQEGRAEERALTGLDERDEALPRLVLPMSWHHPSSPGPSLRTPGAYAKVGT